MFDHPVIAEFDFASKSIDVRKSTYEVHKYGQDSLIFHEIYQEIILSSTFEKENIAKHKGAYSAS